MSPNEIYCKGLTDAEDQALEKLSKAFIGESSEPFANPKLEEFRCKMLNAVVSTTTYNPPASFGELDFENFNNRTNVTYFDGNVPAEEIRSILLNEEPTYNYFPPVGSDNIKVIKSLCFIRDFIYPKAAKGNNGSKNYMYIVEELKNILQ